MFSDVFNSVVVLHFLLHRHVLSDSSRLVLHISLLERHLLVSGFTLDHLMVLTILPLSRSDHTPGSQILLPSLVLVSPNDSGRTHRLGGSTLLVTTLLETTLHYSTSLHYSTILVAALLETTLHHSLATMLVHHFRLSHHVST